MQTANEHTIFAEALGMPSPHERAGYLDRACAGDAELRARIEALLAGHEGAGDFLEVPPPGLTLGAGSIAGAALALERPGTMVGPYKLLEQIGEGGMGVVFMAEQLRPVQRRVAIKILKPGLDTKQVIARFEAERQALAMMEHPSIARVFDAGATGAGRPYFVMELVRGIPITEYCDQNRLTPRQRLGLFVQVCQAVQHAHTKGIIHRDLKPTNVLVTLADDGKPVPKIIDFGIAKATGGQRLTEQTLFTEFRQLVGTPLYMSPEQAEMSALQDVDTRSDVYSLGVLLYELLTGTTPFDKQRLARAAYDEVRRIIREEEPPRPSTRLSTLGQTLTSVCAQRQMDARKLHQSVRGELDWIVMKALEKDRGRRYETASAFSQDVDRYLADEPVQACPPTRVYRFRKTVRRNKTAIAVAGAILIVLLAATAVSSWQAVRARRAKAASDRAAATATRVATYLNDFIATAAYSSEEKDKTARQMLDSVSDKLNQGLENDPEVEAALRMSLAQTYQWHFGSAADTERHTAKAVELYRRIRGEHDERYADSLALHAYALLALRRGPPAQAEAEARQAVEVFRERGIRDGRFVFAAGRLIDALKKTQKPSEIGPLRNELIAIGQADPKQHVLASTVAGDAAMERHDYATAEAFYRRADQVAVAGKDPRRDWIKMGLASAMTGQRKFAEGIEVRTSALAGFRHDLAPDHWNIGHALYALTDDLRAARDSSALVSVFPNVERVKQMELIYRASLGVTPTTSRENPCIAAFEGLRALPEIYLGLGREFAAAGNTAEADAAQRKAVELRDSLRKELSNVISAYSEALKRQPDRVELWASRGECYRQVGDFVKMREDYARAARLDSRNRGYFIALGSADVALGDHKQSILDHSSAIALGDTDANSRLRRGMSYQALNQWPQAIQDYSRAIELNPSYWGNWFARARLYSRMGRQQEARADVANALKNSPGDEEQNDMAWELATSPNPAFRDITTALAVAERVVKSSPLDQTLWNTLGVARYRAGDYAKAVEALEKSRGFHDEKTFSWDAFFLAMAHWQLGHKTEARDWYDQAIAWMDKNQPHNEELVRFRAEAEALMNPRGPTTAPTSQPR